MYLYVEAFCKFLAVCFVVYLKKNIVSVCRKQEMGRKIADIRYGQKQIQPPEKCKYLQRKSFWVNFGWAG